MCSKDAECWQVKQLKPLFEKSSGVVLLRLKESFDTCIVAMRSMVVESIGETDWGPEVSAARAWVFPSSKQAL